ncbi:MAG: haloacid dehalogenase-like hydrolase [Anaerolineales bacterium]|nr:haloacid dehalogenase-like hydrolase [Anaerolineales bacterium]
MTTLILFDIDGTLIRSNSAGRAAMAYALTKACGTAGPLDSYHMGGKTDPRIITDLLVAAGCSPEEIQSKLPIIYDLMTAQAHETFPGKGIQACLGVPELLAALGQRSDVVLGLLTGNIVSTAPLKLGAAGLDAGQFRVGAYGSDHMDRNQLPFIAMQRASQLTGEPFEGTNTVIVGDTPADILCARAGKATAVAVASGWHSAATLAQYKPDHLLENLGDTEKVLEILLASQDGQSNANTP